MSFKAGDCYKNIYVPNGPPSHYWFVLSDPLLDPDHVLVANFTEWDDWWGDGACRLQPGDHPQITKTSYVNYEDAKLHSVASLEAWEQSGRIKRYGSACQDLLQLMQRGVLDSDFCKNAFKRLLNGQGLPGPPPPPPPPV